ncbi:hypothetical protein ACLQ3C_03715 [Gordonia sp. DT30]|uniref:hypothetical protein n=1 Tax=unclassified Gordonia (in: high G+C Gram-positive bacteria) TaxID=2657482 RepID=UPI003CF10CEA
MPDISAFPAHIQAVLRGDGSDTNHQPPSSSGPRAPSAPIPPGMGGDREYRPSISHRTSIPRNDSEDTVTEGYERWVRDKQARREEYERRVSDSLDEWWQSHTTFVLVPDRIAQAIRREVEESFLKELKDWARQHPEVPREP